MMGVQTGHGEAHIDTHRDGLQYLSAGLPCYLISIIKFNPLGQFHTLLKWSIYSYTQSHVNVISFLETYSNQIPGNRV